MSERTRLHYPTVYVVHTEDKNRYKSVPDYTVYVGGRIAYEIAPRSIWRRIQMFGRTGRILRTVYSRMLLPRGSMLLLMGISTSRWRLMLKTSWCIICLALKRWKIWIIVVRTHRVIITPKVSLIGFFRIFGLGFITGSGVIPLRGDHSWFRFV